MGMPRCKYAVYDNGIKIFEGTSLECSKIAGCNQGTVSTNAKVGSRYNKRFTFEKIGGEKETIDEYRLKEIEKSLLLFGNTIIKKQADKTLEAIKKDGLIVKATYNKTFNHYYVELKGKMMKYKIKEIIEMQKQLDLEIYTKHKTEFSLDRTLLALFDELGELNHELKAEWCWWKNTQAPVNRNRVLEELIDCLHFATTISYQLEAKNPKRLEKSASIIELFRNVTNDEKHAMLYVLQFGEELGFTFDEMYNAYIKKNEVNHKRQEGGY